MKMANLQRWKLSPNADREWQKLRREVDILRSLPPHPNIVRFIDSFEDGSWFMIVLELVGGGDLFTILTTRPTARFQEAEACYVFRQVLAGLEFLHSQRVIHRDLKLENIIVAAHRRSGALVLYDVKITDFGLSKLMAPGSAAVSTVGTPPYCAGGAVRRQPRPQLRFVVSGCLALRLYCWGVPF